MPDRDGNRSNPYHPNPDWCCEACIFGRGAHAAWCNRDADLRRALTDWGTIKEERGGRLVIAPRLSPGPLEGDIPTVEPDGA